MATQAPLKILVLSPEGSNLFGGAEQSLLDLFDYWTKHYDIQPTFILPEPLGPLAKALRRRRWPFHTIRYGFWSNPVPLPSPAAVRANNKRNLQATAKIAELIGRLKPDLVMTNTLSCPWAALAAKRQAVPHVWLAREFGNLSDRQFDMPAPQTFADVDKLSNLVVANSESLANYLKDYIKPAKLTTLYPLFNIDELQKQARAKTRSPFRQPDSLKLVMVGSISPIKGQLEAVATVAELKEDGYNLELCLAGNFADRSYVEAIRWLIKQKNLKDQVQLVGFRADAPAVIASADVALVCSGGEAFGRMTFEYLALGKPVIGLKAGATPEMVEDGRNGYLYDKGQPVDLGKAIIRYAEKPSLIKTHGRAAETKARQMMKSGHNPDKLYMRLKTIARQPISPAGNTNYETFLENPNPAAETDGRAYSRWRRRQALKPLYYKWRRIKVRF